MEIAAIGSFSVRKNSQTALPHQQEVASKPITTHPSSHLCSFFDVFHEVDWVPEKVTINLDARSQSLMQDLKSTNLFLFSMSGMFKQLCFTFL